MSNTKNYRDKGEIVECVEALFLNDFYVIYPAGIAVSKVRVVGLSVETPGHGAPIDVDCLTATSEQVIVPIYELYQHPSQAIVALKERMNSQIELMKTRFAPVVDDPDLENG